MFEEHPFWQDTLQTAVYGVLGKPLPYSVTNDGLLTTVLLCCLLAVLLVARHRQKAVSRPVLVIVSCVVTAMLCYLRLESDGTVLSFSERHTGLWAATGLMAAYFIVKAIIQSVVNNVFFSPAQCRQWTATYWTAVVLTGIGLLPLVIAEVLVPALGTLPALNTTLSLVYVVVIVAAVKIWCLLRAFAIFFKGIDWRSQIILYFCTLELIPPLLLAGTMVMIVDCLKLNY